MPPRRVPMMQAPPVLLSGSDSDSDDHHFHFMARCVSCNDEYDPNDDAGTCKECYEEANETKQEMKEQIEELKAKSSFLALASPIGAPSSTTDVILVASADAASRPVPAHKAVLVSRSPVLRAMLENDMEESRSGTIRITDISYDTLCSFVNYLYTAEAIASSLDSQMACNLLALAEKYQVNHLKTFCEKYLISKLNWEKALALYSFANQHNANQLQDAALEFIINDNMAGLAAHEDYQDLVDSNPRLVVEIYEAYLTKQVNTAVLNL